MQFMPDLTSFWKKFNLFFEQNDLLTVIHLFGYFFLGVMITLVVRWFVGKLSQKNLSPSHSLLLRRITLYFGIALSFIFPLQATGIDTTPLLGIAGILTAAVAFAAQAPVSNFLSGIFLIAEKPFEIGDMITFNEHTGEVLSIDMLSVKVRTRDNTLVRIPNENLLKSKFKNLSRFTIRRIDIQIRVNFDEDLEKVRRILLNIVAHNPLCLVTPAPEVTFVEFGDSSIILKFSVWAKQELHNQLLTEIQMNIQKAFKEEKIELPIHHGYGTA